MRRMEEMKRIALDRLGLAEVRAEQGIEVVGTVRGPRELDDAARTALGETLASRIRNAIEARSINLADARIASAEIDSSDEADCEDLQGRMGNAFVMGDRCYRLVVRLAG